MSFSNLVSDLAFRDSNADERGSQISHAQSRTARSYASTNATSVSISGDISSQLHAGYSHPLSRSWQAERQLTKVSGDSPQPMMVALRLTFSDLAGDAHLPTIHHRQPR